MTSGVALSARFAGKKVVARRSVPAATVRRGATVTAAAAAPATAARKFNFSAGPAMLPLDVLEECKEDMINYKGTGMSVMEMSHRGKDFMKIASEAEADLRELVGIPDNYKVCNLVPREHETKSQRYFLQPTPADRRDRSPVAEHPFWLRPYRQPPDAHRPRTLTATRLSSHRHSR
jgi:hypothetical protein